MHRREMLRLLSLSTVAGTIAWRGPSAGARSAAFSPQTTFDAGFVPDVELLLTAAQDEVAVLPGAPTRVWRFSGRLIRGPADTLHPQPTTEVDAAWHRVRLLNGSNARISKLAWSRDVQMAVIGGDGGLLETPLHQQALTLAPGQRADLLLDLTGLAAGADVHLESQAFAEAGLVGMMGMRGRGMRGMMGGRSHVPNGTPLRVMTLRTRARQGAAFRVPERLSSSGAAWAPRAGAPACSGHARPTVSCDPSNGRTRYEHVASRHRCRRVAGHGARAPRRNRSRAGAIQTSSRAVPPPLPYPRARRHGDDAELPGDVAASLETRGSTRSASFINSNRHRDSPSIRAAARRV